MYYPGNDKAAEYIRTCKSKDRFPHAFLVCGEKGTGKTEFARFIAETAVCSENDAPCGKCPNCVKAQKNIHPDIHFVLGKEKTGIIPIDAIRALKKEMFISPNEAQKKVFIIPHGENLNTESANALLKVLEEPSETAVLVITSPDEEAVLPTILSRTVPVTLREASPDDAKQLGLSDTAISIFGGNIGKCKKYDSVAEYRALFKTATKIITSAGTGTPLSLLTSLAPLEESRQVFVDTMSVMRDFYRKISTGLATEKINGFYKLLSAGYTAKRAAKGEAICGEAMTKCRQNLSLSLLVTWFAANL